MGRSAVAGVINKDGALSVVVTQRWRMQNHVHKGDKIFIIPGLYVQEPVPLSEVPALVKTVQDYIARWIATRNDPDSLNIPAIRNYRGIS